ncbi:hypothetical protein psal_cds_1329 [Pandoravirus salinus]|uniref:Uncharacterized protein n=1 Tax=Pandoravirus salinus TaxID=1349410 RepID=S4W5Q8_9VIRU|nr:hypothetical protein psal_cds_1329 [Pandoravirus salinus]AGO85715.1 hypothetical protein psal_cds_1329 [Pandoravirus salinus]
MRFAHGLFDPFALPGSADVVAYAVDACRCQPPNEKALADAARSGRVDLLREAHRRRWLDNPFRFRKVWAASVECGADDVASWLADHAPEADLHPPFRKVNWLPFEPRFDVLVVSHLAGCAWVRDHLSRMPQATHIIWAAAHAWTIDGIRVDRLLSTCATALALVPRDSHTHPFDVPQAQPLTVMTHSQAAVVRARISVRTWARSMPPLDVDASHKDKLLMLREGCYRLDERDDVFGLLPECASSCASATP